MNGSEHPAAGKDQLLQEIHSALDFLEDHLKRIASLEQSDLPGAIDLLIELRHKIITAYPASARPEQGPDNQPPSENPEKGSFWFSRPEKGSFWFSRPREKGSFWFSRPRDRQCEPPEAGCAYQK